MATVYHDHSIFCCLLILSIRKYRYTTVAEYLYPPTCTINNIVVNKNHYYGIVYCCTVITAVAWPWCCGFIGPTLEEYPWDIVQWNTELFFQFVKCLMCIQYAQHTHMHRIKNQLMYPPFYNIICSIFNGGRWPIQFNICIKNKHSIILCESSKVQHVCVCRHVIVLCGCA